MLAHRTLPVAAWFAVVVPAQTTWIVAANGSGQFTAIGPAYDAAAPGDTILVRPGSYLGFDRNPAKGVRILGDGAGVVVSSPIFLMGVPAGQHLHLGGFQIDARNNATGSLGALGSGLTLQDCPSFALSELDVLGPHVSATGWYWNGGGSGIDLFRCTGVLSGVTARGGNGGTHGSLGTRGGPGLGITDSRVAVSHGTFRAGDAGQGSWGMTPTYASCSIGQNSIVALDESTLAPGQPTGPALAVHQSRVLLANHTASITGAIGLNSSSGSIEFDGPVTPTPISNPLTPRAQPGLVGPGSVPRGGAIVWTVHGGANQVALAVASLGILPFAYPTLLDTQLFTATLPSSVYMGLVTIGAGGTTTLSFPVPNLPWLVNEHVALQVVGWASQPRWKASGVALTRIR